MGTAVFMALTMSSPILVIFGLLALAGWRDRRREAMVARQIRLTDALADQLGAIVAPVVTKPLGRPWRVDIRVPVGRPTTVSHIVSIAHDTLTRTGAGRYELVLTPDISPAGALRRRAAGRRAAPGCVKKREAAMVDLMLAGGILVALAGVFQTAARRERRRASPLALLQEGMGTLEAADAEAVRAEFRRSGVALPERRDPIGFV